MKYRLWIGWLGFVVVLVGTSQLGVRWNVSPSLPAGLYLERDRPAATGDLVLVCLPETVGRWARRRGYLANGSCPGESRPLGKWVVAVEGDRIEVRADRVLVNGMVLEGSRREPIDARGRPVPLAEKGVFWLGPRQVWLHSGRHRRSLDSRVYGPLTLSSIHTVLEPLWILPET